MNRTEWSCPSCGRMVAMLGRVRVLTPPVCVHTGTSLVGTEPCPMVMR